MTKPLYYRVHWSDCPEFCADNAYSRPWGEYGSDDVIERDGYSCFEDPDRLLRYFELRGCADDEQVVIFEGDLLDIGDDNEELVVPTRVVRVTTWKEFKGELT